MSYFSLPPNEPLESCKSLLEQARREGLLIRSCYAGIILTPEELEEAQRIGRFRWGPVNWVLVRPEEILADIDSEIAVLVDRRTRLLTQMETRT